MKVEIIYENDRRYLMKYHIFKESQLYKIEITEDVTCCHISMIELLDFPTFSSDIISPEMIQSKYKSSFDRTGLSIHFINILNSISIKLKESSKKLDNLKCKNGIILTSVMFSILMLLSGNALILGFLVCLVIFLGILVVFTILSCFLIIWVFKSLTEIYSCIYGESE